MECAAREITGGRYVRLLSFVVQAILLLAVEPLLAQVRLSDDRPSLDVAALEAAGLKVYRSRHLVLVSDAPTGHDDCRKS